jgi:PleD family two-component response regulator
MSVLKMSPDGTEEKGSVTVSVGAAQMQQGDEAVQLLEAADRALFRAIRAKQAGRNRVQS